MDPLSLVLTALATGAAAAAKDTASQGVKDAYADFLFDRWVSWWVVFRVPRRTVFRVGSRANRGAHYSRTSSSQLFKVSCSTCLQLASSTLSRCHVS